MATAVSFRYGNKDQHITWTEGVKAEITVDPDVNSGTIYYHTGNPNDPGVPLARADGTNLNDAFLASSGPFKSGSLVGFMRYDLSNFSPIGGTNYELGETMAAYLGYYTKAEIDGKSFAKTDLSNLESGALNTAHILDYNLSNITSTGTGIIQNMINASTGSFITISDVNTALVPYAQISYVDDQITSISSRFSDYQLKSQRVVSITSSSDNDHYPTAKAVVDYVNQNVSAEFAKSDLSNITDWGAAVAETPFYKFDIFVDDPGSNYSNGDVIHTDISFPSPEDPSVTATLDIIVTLVDADGKIVNIQPDPMQITTSIPVSSYTDPVHGGDFTISTVIQGQPGNLLDKTTAANTYAQKIPTESHISNNTIHVTASDKTTWSGKQDAITINAKLSSDLVDDSNHTNLFVTANDKTTWNGKQNAITGAATTITSNNLTASRALISNSSGKVAVSATTSTELGYVSGVTSSIQTQLNNKAETSSLKTVATTGSYNDLTDKPTIPAAQVNSDWNASSGVAKILNKPSIPQIDTTYSSSGTNAVIASAIEGEHFVRGSNDGGSATMPTHIAIYNTDNQAQSASVTHPTWVCFSLGLSS